MTDTYRTDRAHHRPARPRPGVATTAPPRTRSSTRPTTATLGVRRRRRAARPADPARPRRRHALPARLHRVPAAAGGPRPAACRSASRVTHLDGLVLARSQFHHSANYRSVVAHGTRPPGHRRRREARGARPRWWRRSPPGRAARQPPADRAELAADRRAGAAAARGLGEGPHRRRDRRAGGPRRCRTGPAWCRCALTPGLPEPDAGVTAPVPGVSAARPRRLAHAAPTLRGEHVILEPLDLSARRRAVRRARRRRGLPLADPPGRGRPRAEHGRRGRATALRRHAARASGCRWCSAAPAPAR